ncbi:thymidylate kinase [Patescibacteria group bacterium]|nr:thymidylate kinase [Patescibacteria group bacterium]MBU1500004.1 thymidylate kinase [Patescibacteria group bacterium]
MPESFTQPHCFKERLLPQGIVWVALDGGDAVGKTTLVPLVAQSLLSAGVYSIGMPEFSDLPTGKAIKNALNDQRFFSLRPDKITPMADTLVLISDLMAQIEASSKNLAQGGVIVSDRGPASLIAYQAIRLYERDPKHFLSLDSAVSWVATLVETTGLHPDMTMFLTTDESTIQKRIINRGEPPLSTDELQFLRQVNMLMEQYTQTFSNTTHIIDSGKSLADITQQIVKLIRKN